MCIWFLDKVEYKYSKDIEYYFTYEKVLSKIITFDYDTFTCSFPKRELFRFKKEMEATLIPKKHWRTII